jgi:sugar (pentulose or hexulose) kinase
MTDLDHSTLVLDVGKTNVKILVMSKAGAVLDTEKLDNKSLDGPPYPHPDIERIWQWLLATTTHFANQYTIDAIVPTTHGCTAALVCDDELVLPILDYETEIPDDTTETFAAVAPTFAETQSPNLPAGLNLGRQLFWLQREFPQQFSRTQWILTYPQYWAWRLCGVAASEITSVGCHGHLWNPQQRSFSTLVDRQDWRRLFPPLKPAYAALGPICPEIAHTTGLPPTCQVYNGIHDSNAAYSLYLRGHAKPFSLVSTGTWVIMISPRLPLSSLNEHRDMLALVDLRGEPVPTGRYMGGREFEILSQEVGSDNTFTEADLRSVIAKRSFLLPSFAPGGPFMGRQGSTLGPQLETPGEILARATLYLTLMTVTSTDMLAVDGDLMIDGGFVNNPWYCRLLATLAGCPRCFMNHQTEGTAVGAGMLASWHDNDMQWPLHLTLVDPFEDPGLAAYVEQWQQAIDS